MTGRRLACFFVFLALWGVESPLAQAHHGPPHDEIDEFDSPAARMIVPASRVSWPAVAVSVAGVAAMYWASRRRGVDAPTPVRVRP